MLLHRAGGIALKRWYARVLAGRGRGEPRPLEEKISYGVPHRGSIDPDLGPALGRARTAVGVAGVEIGSVSLVSRRARDEVVDELGLVVEKGDDPILL